MYRKQRPRLGQRQRQRRVRKVSDDRRRQELSHRLPSFINDQAKTSIPATNVKITRPPKSGKVAVTGSGLVYTPASGFKGNDRFCTTNTTPKVKGKMLRGCITVTVK